MGASHFFALHYRKLLVSYNAITLREDAITAQRKIA